MPSKLSRCDAPPMTLCSYHGAAAPEAEVVQARGQQGRGSPSLCALLEGRLYDIPRPPAQRGHCGGVPVQCVRLLSVATVVGYLHNTWYQSKRCFTKQGSPRSRASWNNCT